MYAVFPFFMPCCTLPFACLCLELRHHVCLVFTDCTGIVSTSKPHHHPPHVHLLNGRRLRHGLALDALRQPRTIGRRFTDLGSYSSGAAWPHQPLRFGSVERGEAHALQPVLTHLRRFSPIPVCIQLAHAGRKASCARPWEGGGALPASHPQAWLTLSASALGFLPTDPTPASATLEDIAQIQQAFVDAALRSHALGLDAIELHAAHGYLLHQFLSPLSNLREDSYGGSLENRMRLTLEVFEAMRNALPAGFPIGVRISATDWVEGGWEIEQSKVLAQALADRGCAFLHASSAALHPAQQIPLAPGYQVPLAQALRDSLDGRMPVIAVGLITETQQAEAILQAGQADAIGVARAMLYNPRWPWEAARQLGASAVAAPQYLRCEPRGAKNLLHTRTPH